jgi:hypothetical protein
MKMIKTLFLVLLLAGCGSGGDNSLRVENHGYGFEFDAQGTTGLRLRSSGSAFSDVTYYEATFAEVKTCAGIEAPAPFVILTSLDGPTGVYYSAPSLILLDMKHLSTENSSLFKHEVVHYLLDHSTGDADPNHTSALFAKCT